MVTTPHHYGGNVDPTIPQLVDAALIREITALDHQIRVRAERLADLNHEWTRRHRTERCAVNCREPRAPLSKAV